MVVQIIGAPGPQATATLKLDESTIAWPYHSAVQRAAAAELATAESFGQIEEIAGDGVRTVTVDGPDGRPSDTELFVIRVEADDNDTAVAAADAAAELVITQDLARELNDPNRRLDEINAQVIELERAETELFAEVSVVGGDELIIVNATLEETAAALGEFRTLQSEAEVALGQIVQRYDVVESGAAVNHLLDGLRTALVIGLSLAIIAFVVRRAEDLFGPG